MQKPILVLQMQRMGDLILSFPLLALLQNAYPDTPLWTVAEEAFFSEFYTLAPKTVFFPPSAAANLQTQSYEAVINLSHREDAAVLAGKVDAEQRFGAYTQNNHNYIGGEWPLYRASIVHNNSYNLYHWSDLYLLDHMQGDKIPAWKGSLSITPKEKTVGIFVGASEKEKRPTPLFFAKLAKSLARKGYRTFFLGGPADIPIAKEAESLSGIKGSCLCGTFSLEQLVVILKKLTLFITPDTGPMHLATWVNTPILNISVGPVNPWETGPRSAHYVQHSDTISGHYIVQPALSCSGCWQACTGTQRCQNLLHAERVALLAHAIIQSTPENNMLSRIELPHLNILKAGSDALGRHNLLPINNQAQDPKILVGRFWQAWFWERLRREHTDTARQEYHTLCTHSPHTADMLRQGIVQLGTMLRKNLKDNLKGKQQGLPQQAWKYFPSPVHPLSGFLHLYLQNKEYSMDAWEKVLEDMESLYKIF